MIRRLHCWLACALLGATLMLAGCARPTPPTRDIVTPDVPEPPVPEELEPVETAEPGLGVDEGLEPVAFAGLRVFVIAPDAVLEVGEDLDIRVEEGDPGGASGVVAYVDGNPIGTVNIGDPPLVHSGLDPGPHLLRLAAVGETGVNTDEDGLLTRPFRVGVDTAAEESADWDVSGPILTVAEPYGPTVPADDGSVVFDFRLDNVTLGEGSAVLKWQVDEGEAETLYEYPAPEVVTLRPLDAGEHTLTAWLEGPDGQPLENGGLARVVQAFTVAAPGGAEPTADEAESP